MKVRLGFVSNSSSASFVIKRESLSEAQIKKIYDYEKCGRLKKCREEEERCEGCVPEMFEYNDFGWEISQSKDEIKGCTAIDNFDMRFYLVEVVGIQMESIKYESDNE
jgi:hypothetical protein